MSKAAILLRKIGISSSQIARRVAQILLAEAVEMLSGRKIKLVDNIRKRDIWQ